MTYEMDGIDSGNTSGDEPTVVGRTEYGADSYVEEMSDGSTHTYEKQEFGDGSETVTDNRDYADGSYDHNTETTEGDYTRETSVDFDGSDTMDVYDSASDSTTEIIGRDD